MTFTHVEHVYYSTSVLKVYSKYMYLLFNDNLNFVKMLLALTI